MHKILTLLISDKPFLSEYEHSDSEFYYPSELSDTQMQQLPTHSKATDRKPLLSNQEIE